MWQSPKITPLLQTSNAGSDSTIAWVGVHPTRESRLHSAGNVTRDAPQPVVPDAREKFDSVGRRPFVTTEI